MAYEEQDEEGVAFAHPSGIFSLSYPAGWSVADASAPNRVQTTFHASAPPVLVQITLEAAPVDDSDDAMDALIRQLVAAQAGSKEGFALDTVELQPDDSIWASYSYGTGAGATVGDALIWIDEPLIISLVVEQSEAAVEQTQPLIDDMIDSLAIDSAVALPV